MRTVDTPWSDTSVQHGTCRPVGERVYLESIMCTQATTHSRRMISPVQYMKPDAKLPRSPCGSPAHGEPSGRRQNNNCCHMVNNILVG